MPASQRHPRICTGLVTLGYRLRTKANRGIPQPEAVQDLPYFKFRSQLACIAPDYSIHPQSRCRSLVLKTVVRHVKLRMVLAGTGLTRKEHAISSARHWARHGCVPSPSGEARLLLIMANSVTVNLCAFPTAASLHICIAVVGDTFCSYERSPQAARNRACFATPNRTMSRAEVAHFLYNSS